MTLSSSPSTKLSNESDRGLVLNRYKTADEALVIHQTAREYPGKPFYTLDEGYFLNNAKAIVEGFCPNLPYAHVAYAMKANSDPNVMGLLGEAGISYFDCATTEEVQRVREIFPDAVVLSNNPAKPRIDYEEEFQLGVRHWTVDTRDALEELLEVIEQQETDEKVEIAVRVETPNETANSNLSEKFGFDESEAAELLKKIIQQPGIDSAASIHIGSQTPDPAVFAGWIKTFCDFIRRTGRVKRLNFGGGIPVNYYPDQSFDPLEFIRVISTTIEENIEGTLLEDPEIYVELGRVLVAQAIKEVIPVIRRKERRGGNYLHIGESRYGGLAANAQLNPPWVFYLDPVAQEGKQFSKRNAYFRLWGRTCDSSDGLKGVDGKLHPYEFPENIARGDLLVTPAAGAYERACASNFHLYPRPPYVHFNCIK